MTAILDTLTSFISSFFPNDIYVRLDLLYNVTIICLGAGIILMLLAVVFMIIALRKRKKHTQEI